MKKLIIAMVLACTAVSAFAQWDDGILINVQEIDIEQMRAVSMQGAEAVLKVVEQYVDSSYRFAYISNNYVVPLEQQRFMDIGTHRFMVVVVGYPGMNNLLYVQVFFDTNFFFVILCKKDNDVQRSTDIQIIKMNYEKANLGRRNNVRDTIQRNNIIPLGIEQQ